MIDFIYSTLAAMGFTHPLHPIFTHIPMGMVIGGFLFKVFSYKWNELENSAFYCYILALIFAPIVIIFGILDWQYKLLGQWNYLIVTKLVLSTIFLILLALTVYLWAGEKAGKRLMLFLYTLIFITIMTLGFFGGELAYG